ncbi:MAG: ATP phosphoribosyltransferase regulatory subunit [Butyrivibrio sp.]|nr:ATP phosphoribosyltransferase regulatory subunit [Butyrivibrio sp.]
MNRKLLHTPEGVRDIYDGECNDMLYIQKKINEKFKSFGFKDIITPTFEFFDVFADDLSDTSARELYKFFDKEGNTLALRPDFTPSMARCVSKYFLESDEPVRICYSGNTFLNTSNLQGKLKESTEMGVELMKDDSVYADAEMITLMVEALQSSGLNDFQISIGDAGYYKGICEEAGIDDETEREIRELIAGKNIFAAESLMIEKNVPVKYRDMLVKVSDFRGAADALDEAAELVDNDRSRKVLERLGELYEVLKLYRVEKYVSFDLGMISMNNYYTGVIFNAYTYGVGDAIARGGRYDNLLGKFGKDAPAIGFMIVIDDLLSALHRQNVQIVKEADCKVVTYTEENYIQKLGEAQKLRNEGFNVVLTRE